MGHIIAALSFTSVVLLPHLAESSEINNSSDDLEIRVGATISETISSLEAFGAVDITWLTYEPFAHYCYHLKSPHLTILLSESKGKLVELRVRNSSNLSKFDRVSYAINSLRLADGQVNIDLVTGRHKTTLIYVGMDKAAAITQLKIASIGHKQVNVDQHTVAFHGFYDQFGVTISFSKDKMSTVNAIQVRNSKSDAAPVSVECLNCDTMVTDFAFLVNKTSTRGGAQFSGDE